MCTHLLPTAIILLPSLAQVPHLNAPASRHTPPLQLCICLSQSRSLSLQCSFQLTSAEAVLDRSKAYVGVCVTCVYIYIYTRVYIYIYVTALSHTQQPFLKGLRESAMYYHLLLIQQMDRGVSHMTQASLFKLERFHVRPIIPIPPSLAGRWVCATLLPA